jgi:hypothetical protein
LCLQRPMLRFGIGQQLFMQFIWDSYRELFHDGIIPSFCRQIIYTICLESRLKPGPASNLWGSIPEACSGLKPVSVKGIWSGVGGDFHHLCWLEARVGSST